MDTNAPQLLSTPLWRESATQQTLPKISVSDIDEADAIVVDIGLCRPELGALGVRNIISTKELKEAPKVLTKLDKDKDGQLTREELRPAFGRGPGGRGGPGGERRGPGGPGGP